MSSSKPVSEADTKLIEENTRLKNRVNLLAMQLQAMEEKRTLMNRLYKTAKDCRAAQKTYFNNRSQENLRISKAAERKLDDALGELIAGRRQMQLGI